MNKEFIIDTITFAALIIITLLARWKAEKSLKDFIDGKKNRIPWLVRWIFPDEDKYNPHIKRFLWLIVLILFLIYCHLFITFAIRKHVLHDTYNPGFLTGILYPFRAIYLLFK